MAPAKKKPRVKVDEGDSSSSNGRANRSSELITPISILKGLVANYSTVNPAPRTDEPERLSQRRQTYVIHREDTFEEHGQVEVPDADAEPERLSQRRKTYVIHREDTFEENDKVEVPDAVDDQNRPFTSVVTSSAYGGTEMSLSEMEKTEIKSQSTTLQESKPKKRGRKKKTLPALQEDSVVETENSEDKKEQEKESLVSSASTSGKPKKHAQKKSARSKNVTRVTIAAQRKLRPERHSEVDTGIKRKC